MPRISPKNSTNMGSQPMMPASMRSPGPSKMPHGMDNMERVMGMSGAGSNSMKSSMSSPVTYIPPLRDGACGTTPRCQMPMMAMMRHEMAQMMQMMPSLCWAMLTQHKHMSMAGMGDMMMHMMLAAMEMCMLAAAIPLYMMLPGAMFMTWMTVCAMMVMGMCWMLNGREQMHQCSSGAEGWMMGHEAEDEKWMFVGGMGMSSRHCHTMTLPMMSRLFSRPMTCVCMPTYGLPFDMMMMMMQRCMPMPSQARRNLYSQMRCALLDDSMQRCVVMCMNHSAILVSQAVAQLCADLPADKLCKLEIYTFGSAACEFMMPVGEANLECDPAHPDTATANGMTTTERKGVHVEHFAMANDPFAQMGVLQSVRMNMDGRCCGGVFIMNNNMAMSMHNNSSAMHMDMSASCGLMMEDYLMALFPTQMSSMAMKSMAMPMVAPMTVAGSGVPCSMLDCVMHIDRDCAEKRELAAMASYYTASHARQDMNGQGTMRKRMSWTGLAMSNGMDKNGMDKNGMSAGMVGLEMARKGCEGCKGHVGRDVSWLPRHMGMMGQAPMAMMGMPMEGGKKGMAMESGMGKASN